MAITPPNRYHNRAVTVALADALCFAVAAWVSWEVLAPPFSPLLYATATVIAALGCFAALYYADAYSLQSLSNGRETLHSVVAVMGLAFVAAIVVYHFVPTSTGSIPVLANTAAIYFPLLLMARMTFRVTSSMARALARA